MGISGDLFIGDAIVLNPRLLTQDQQQTLAYLTGRYEDLFEENPYVGKRGFILIWVDEPRTITRNLRATVPIIFDDSNIDNISDMGSEEFYSLPNVSKQFYVRLDDTRSDRDRLYNRLRHKIHMLSPNHPNYFSAGDIGFGRMTAEDMLRLREIIDDPVVTLDGTWMAYLL